MASLLICLFAHACLGLSVSLRLQHRNWQLALTSNRKWHLRRSTGCSLRPRVEVARRGSMPKSVPLVCSRPPRLQPSCTPFRVVSGSNHAEGRIQLTPSLAKASPLFGLDKQTTLAAAPRNNSSVMAIQARASSSPLTPPNFGNVPCRWQIPEKFLKE